MSDTQDLLGDYQASKAITPVRRMVAPTRRTTPRAVRTTTVPRLAIPKLAKPTGGQLAPPQVRKATEKKQDKGWFGDLISIPGSAIGAIGQGIMSLPTLAGKAAQEVYGLGELTFDTVLDAINDDIYTSRLEVDYAKGKELGLKGDELYAYAMHRQHPFIGGVFGSVARTGGRLAELGSLGFYNYGQEGIDYARAFREGNLGATMVEDLGNIALVGGVLGAGSVFGKAGQKISTVAPRTGAAVEFVGRAVTEPVGETVRQGGRLVSKVAPKAGELVEGMRYAPKAETVTRVTNRAAAVANAEHPLRILFNQVGEVYRMNQETKLGNLDIDIANLINERDAATAAGDNATARMKQGEINDLEIKRQKRVEGKGVIRRGRQIGRRVKLLGERAGQQVIQQFNRARDYGVAPETPEVYRARAASLREQANTVEQGAAPYPEYIDAMVGTESPQQVRAQQLRDAADALDNLANLKEQFPNEMSGPVPAHVQEAAIHLATKAHAMLALIDNGMSLEDVVRAATDPTVGPTLATAGMQPTHEGVGLAVEVLRALRGEQTSLNPGQVMQVTGIFNLLKEWSRTAQEAMMRGEGVPEGPVPFTWFEVYPTPAYLAAELAKGGAEAAAIESYLDQAIADFIGAAIDAGVLPAEVLQEWRINLEDPTGSYRRLSALDPDDAGYRIAFEIGRLAYKQLLRVGPNFMMNPRIYPATMRPTIITQQQAVRRVTGYDVETIALKLAELEDQFDTLIDANVLKGIGNDIADALNPQKKITRKVWERVTRRLQTVLEQAQKRRLELESRASALTAEQNVQLTKLIELEQALTAADNMLKRQAAAPVAKSPRLIGAENRRADLDAERARLSAELDKVNADINDAAQAEVIDAPRLRSIIDGNTTRVEELQGRIDEIDTELGPLEQELDRLSSEVNGMDRLTESERENLALDYADLINEGYTPGEAPVSARAQREPTPAELKNHKQRTLDELKQVEDEAADFLFNTMIGSGEKPMGRTRRPDDPNNQPGNQPRDYTIDGLEDWRQVVQSILGNDKMYQDFLDEATGWDKRGGVNPVDYPTGAAFSETSAYEAPGYDVRLDNGVEPQMPEAWLEEYARKYKELWEARQRRLELQKKPNKWFADDWKRAQAESAPEISMMRYGLSRLSPDEIATYYKYLDSETLANARREIKDMQAEVDKLRAERRKLNDQAQKLDAESRDARGRLKPPIPRELSVKATRLQVELRRLSRQQSQTPRVLKAARKAEPTEALRAEQAALRGTAGEVRRPAPGAEGPALGRVRRPRRLVSEKEQARLNREDSRRTTVLRRLRNEAEQQGALEAAALEAQGTPLQRPEFTPEGMPFGPELFGEGQAPLYLPAGPTRGMLPERDLQAVMRGEGAGAQTELQATRERVSGAMVLSLASMAERIREFTAQQYGNIALDQILLDPMLASTVDKLLDEDQLAQIRMDAEQAVLAQNIDRTAPEFEREVTNEFGVRVIDAVKQKGYDIVAPQKVDPVTGGHAPMGTLTSKVKPNQVAENSPVMRIGVAERLFSQFEPKGSRNVPVMVQRTLDFMNTVTSKWKSVILPLSLRWQIGDAVGIVMFAWTRGDINPRQLVKRIRETIGRMTDPNDPRLGMILFGDVLGSGVGGMGAFADPVVASGFGAALSGRGLRLEDLAFTMEDGRRVLADPNYRPGNKATRFFNDFRQRAFRFNEAINSIGRTAVYIEKLDRALRAKGRSLDEIDGVNTFGDAELNQAIRDAVDATNETLGAFSDLSPFEKQVMRQIFPFWSWIKFINKAAFELAIDSPERVLFYANLGSMMTEGEDTGLADWLRGKTPVMGYFVDLNFLNPYSDAAMFSRNPFTDVLETGTSVSPAITFTLTVAGELYYGQTGRNLPFAPQLSRPGYLEGRPEANTERGFGDVLGGIGYKGLQTFGGPFRNILDVLPEGTIPGTDVATGPVARFGQGSLRTTGAYAEPRLGPVVGRISPVLRTFGVPAPIMDVELAQKQAKDQAQRDRAARLRRTQERKAAQ